MKKYIVYLILCFVSCFIFSCTSVYENGDTSCIPEGMERLTFKVIVPSSKVVDSSTRSTALEKENEIKDLFVKIGNYDSDHYRNFYSTQNGTIHFDPYAYEDSIYRASIEVPVGTFRDGDDIYVWANQEYPIDVTSEEELTTPLYMSGIGTIRDKWGDNRDFEADVHLLRGVAKLRTVVRTTKRSVLGSWNIDINQVETQILHMPSCIRPFTPFETHRNPAVNDGWNDVYHRYIDCTLNNLGWWISWENSHLMSSVELPIDDGVNVDKVTETSYDRYIYENWLENESDYDENTNVTALKVRIPLWNYETGEDRIIERVIPIKTNDSYRILRNHIYTVDVRVLSVDDIEINMDLLDWKDIDVTGDIVGGSDFDIDRTKITLIKDIVDPVKLVKVNCHTPGRLRIRALKSDKTALMPTTDLQLYCNGITENDKLTDNSGIYDLAAAQVMNFYCTTGSVPANYEGGFIEISSDNVHVEYIPISSLDTFTPLDTEGTANCYIADRGAGSYSFTATIMGNGVDGIIDEGKFEDASGNILTKTVGAADIHPVSAKLLWQDTDELVEQVALVNGRVQVKMGRSRGNAVIAVYDNPDPNAEDAKVLWSWHLWCTATPKILEFVTSIYTGNDYKVMDRNLGATATTAYLGTVQGLHYQWGRKDPFSGSLTYDGIRTILYDVRSGQVVYKYPGERVTVGQAVSTPNSMYCPEHSWCTKTTELKYLWGNPDGEQDVFPKETLKSLYDPCPYGYKVAPHDVFRILGRGDNALFPPIGASLGELYFIKSYFENGSTFYYDNAGIDETKLIYLPETYSPNGVGTRLGKQGVYWCSSPHPAGRESSGLMFNFHIYRTMDFEYNIYNPVVTSLAASIRCVKE
ncbi:hypothetical protein [uncultured Bacteroides sp.]|uniref:hypothetical protein n=1 Tax=uncultured Bacteroides sp. TaxID=162156 RepID=UPI002600E868|nr:hypothetical protein [uncultured Bacteroides sp.]